LEAYLICRVEVFGGHVQKLSLREAQQIQAELMAKLEEIRQEMPEALF